MNQNNDEESFLSIFSNNATFKKEKAGFISQINDGDPSSLITIAMALKKLFEDPKTKPESRLSALYFLKEAVDQNIGDFLLYLKNMLYPKLLTDARFQKEVKDEDRGKWFFSENPDTNLKVKGNSYFRLLLECIEIWAYRYPEDRVFLDGYKELIREGVKFPSTKTYFKAEDEEPRVPIFRNIRENKKKSLQQSIVFENVLKAAENKQKRQSTDSHEDSFLHEINTKIVHKNGEKGDQLETLKAALIIQKKKLQDVLFRKDISFVEVARTMQSMKSLNSEYQNFLLQFPDLHKYIMKDMELLENLLVCYNASIRNDERNFESLKEAFSSLAQERDFSATLNVKKFVSPILTPESPFKSNISPLQKSRMSLDIQDLRTMILSSKEMFIDNFETYMKKWAATPSDYVSLVKFLSTLIKDTSEKALTRYLALKIISKLMEERDIHPLVPEKVALFALEPVSLIARYNYASQDPPHMRFSGFFGNTVNETIEEIAYNYVSLAAKCIEDWGNMRLPNETKTSDKAKFLETYENLKDLGVDFGLPTGGDSSLLLQKKNINAHIKEIGKQKEELKIFLQKNKKTTEQIKKEYLSKMNDNLMNEYAFLNNYQGQKSQEFEESIAFIKEFKRRFKKYNENLITYVQFKKRFLKFFGLAVGDLSSSKISKISTSDIPNTEKEKNTPFSVKNGFLDLPGMNNHNEDSLLLNSRKEIIEKIPQKTIIRSENHKKPLFPGFLELLQSKEPLPAPKLMKIYESLRDSCPGSLEDFGITFQKAFENYSDESYLIFWNLLKLMGVSIENGNSTIVKFIHDHMLKTLLSLVVVGSSKRNSKNQKCFPYQEEFVNAALEYMRAWALKFKGDLFLNVFKKAWNIIIEDLMLELPDVLLEGSTEIAQIREINLKSNQREKEEDLGSIIMNLKPKKPSFRDIFEEKNNEKIPLKGFSKKQHIKPTEKNKFRLKEDARIMRENIELKQRLRNQEEHNKKLEQELKKLKEKIKNINI